MSKTYAPWDISSFAKLHPALKADIQRCEMALRQLSGGFRSHEIVSWVARLERRYERPACVASMERYDAVSLIGTMSVNWQTWRLASLNGGRGQGSVWLGVSFRHLMGCFVGPNRPPIRFARNFREISFGGSFTAMC